MSIATAYCCAIIPRVSFALSFPLGGYTSSGRSLQTASQKSPQRTLFGQEEDVKPKLSFRHSTSATNTIACEHRPKPSAVMSLAPSQGLNTQPCGFPSSAPILNRRPSSVHARAMHSLGQEPPDRKEDWEATLAAISGLITKRHREQIQSDSIEAVQDYLGRLDVDLRQLPVVHVAGTKGKGSTCTMVESILRRKGLTTGLYTSPHLVDVRERIRINGDPLSRQDFSWHFWDVYRRLQDTAEESSFPCLPGYFRYFTVMALTVFVHHKVDVAVVEVGLGGRLDATNVVHPTVCGVSSLGLDHTNLLGDTIDKIAREKAGIFKVGVPAITSPQPAEAMAVLRQHSADVGCQLLEAAPLSQFRTSSPTALAGEDVAIGIPGSMQQTNAALAVALAQAFLRLRPPASAPASSAPRAAELRAEEVWVLPDAFRAGLAHAKSLGRCQLVRLAAEDAEDGRRLSYYLDGAHTRESMASCAEWFHREMAPPAPEAPSRRRVLVFYCSPDRDATALLAPLLQLHAVQPFDQVIICSNDHPALPPGMDPDAWRQQLAAEWQDGSGMKAHVMRSVRDLIPWVEAQAAPGGSSGRWVVQPHSRGTHEGLHVLVTGSLLMCGDLLVKLLHRSGGTEAVDAALKFSDSKTGDHSLASSAPFAQRLALTRRRPRARNHHAQGLPHRCIVNMLLLRRSHGTRPTPRKSEPTSR